MGPNPLLDSNIQTEEKFEERCFLIWFRISLVIVDLYCRDGGPESQGTCCTYKCAGNPAVCFSFAEYAEGCIYS
jgi:hypothetical protein